MRITAKAKEETRTRVLQVGDELFKSKGFEATTTRDLAQAAGLATGTLFNYFPNKHALAMSILDDALAAGAARFERRRRGDESLEEELFALVAAELRELKSHRAFAGDVLQRAFSPFAADDAARAGAAARARHLEIVGAALLRHDRGAEQPVVAMHLYWTLYLGVLAFWCHDDSPKQADTLAVLDQSMRLFVGALKEDGE